MPVNIHGKEYKTVAERLAEVASDTKGKYSLKTKVIGDVNGTVLIKATLELERGTFVGHAYEREDAGYINKTSHVENCETSAVGRALGFAGYGSAESIASADEVTVAIERQKKTEAKLTKAQRKAIEEFLDSCSDGDLKLQKLLDWGCVDNLSKLEKTKAKMYIDKNIGLDVMA